MYYSHLQTAQLLIENFKNEQPFSLYIKNYFRVNKKFGSRDRKTISQACYNYFRIGNVLLELPFEERLQLANFLIDGIDEQNIFGITTNLDERLVAFTTKYPDFNFNAIFPLADELEALNKTDFIKSILTRPRVFIRIRKNFEAEVVKELTENNFEFFQLSSTTLSFDQQVKLTETKSFEKGLFEIQDYSSQQTGMFFNAKPNEVWWDCCAGSGGKSLLFKDAFPEVELVISDVRPSILKNTGERLKKANAKKYQLAECDMLAPQLSHQIKGKTFDGIIIDAPCSGSGTWARTPENSLHFKLTTLKHFQSRQLAIVKNAIHYLKPGGQLIYITCSAFKAENEEVVKDLTSTTKLQLKTSKLIIGAGQQSDTMYVAAFTI